MLTGSGCQGQTDMGFKLRGHCFSCLFIDHDQIKLNHFYRIANKTAPSYLTQVITFTSERHNHNTRFSDKSVTLPSVKGNGLSTYQYTATKLWNDLPGNIKSTPNFNQYKFLVKRHLLSNFVAENNNVFQYF